MLNGLEIAMISHLGGLEEKNMHLVNWGVGSLTMTRYRLEALCAKVLVEK